MPALQKISIRPDWCPAPPDVEAMFVAAEHAGRRFTEVSSDSRVASLVNTSASAAWSILTALDRTLPPDNRRFCEWGSGLGAVACLAARLGWTATGIDNAAPLIDAARDFAADQGLDVTFAHADYGEDAERSGASDLFEADVIYAYAWPTEARWIPDRVARGARSGQVLVMYQGGVTVSAWRMV